MMDERNARSRARSRPTSTYCWPCRSDTSPSQNGRMTAVCTPGATWRPNAVGPIRTRPRTCQGSSGYESIVARSTPSPPRPEMHEEVRALREAELLVGRIQLRALLVRVVRGLEDHEVPRRPALVHEELPRRQARLDVRLVEKRDMAQELLMLARRDPEDLDHHLLRFGERGSRCKQAGVQERNDEMLGHDGSRFTPPSCPAPRWPRRCRPARASPGR